MPTEHTEKHRKKVKQQRGRRKRGKNGIFRKNS